MVSNERRTESGKWAIARRALRGPKAVEKIEDMNSKAESSEDLVQDSTIFPQMVGHTIAIHDGRKHVPIYITEEMVRHKLGSLPQPGLLRTRASY